MQRKPRPCHALGHEPRSHQQKTADEAGGKIGMRTDPRRGTPRSTRVHAAWDGSLDGSAGSSGDTKSTHAHLSVV